MSRLVEVGAEMAAARRAAGLTVPQLAARIGVSQQAVYWWEHGRNAPRPYAARRWFQVLGLPVPDDVEAVFGTKMPHGTRAAYRRHRRRGEMPCQACVEAARVYSRSQVRGAA